MIDRLMKLPSSIVAVHGLGAHPEYTWTVTREEAQPLQAISSSSTRRAPGKRRVNWLKDDDFLKEDFKTARIMTFGYNADWFVGAPTATAQQRAGTLLRELKRERLGSRVCPSSLQHDTVLTLLGNSTNTIHRT